MSSLSHTETLALLNLELRKPRGRRFDLIYYYKILSRLTPFSTSDVLVVLSPDMPSRLKFPYSKKPAEAAIRFLFIILFKNIAARNTHLLLYVLFDLFLHLNVAYNKLIFPFFSKIQQLKNAYFNIFFFVVFSMISCAINV